MRTTLTASFAPCNSTRKDAGGPRSVPSRDNPFFITPRDDLSCSGPPRPAPPVPFRRAAPIVPYRTALLNSSDASLLAEFTAAGFDPAATAAYMDSISATLRHGNLVPGPLIPRVEALRCGTGAADRWRRGGSPEGVASPRVAPVARPARSPLSGPPLGRRIPCMPRAHVSHLGPYMRPYPVPSPAQLRPTTGRLRPPLSSRRRRSVLCAAYSVRPPPTRSAVPPLTLLFFPGPH